MYILKFYLILVLAFFGTDVLAQVRFEFIKERILAKSNTWESDWIMARDISSLFTIQKNFDLSRNYDYFFDKCKVEYFPREIFFCVSNDREWVVSAHVTKLPGSKILFIDRLYYYACITKSTQEAIQNVWSENNINKIYKNQNDATSWYSNGNQQMLLSILGQYDVRDNMDKKKYFPICRNPLYLSLRIERTNDGKKILSNMIYLQRMEESKNTAVEF